MNDNDQKLEEALGPIRDRKFPVLEIFGPTLQGEGNVIGMQTMFIRLGGCDYRCKRCDSLHAVLPKLIKEKATLMTAQEIFNQVYTTSMHCKMVTLSGGNPCMWDLTELCRLLQQEGYTIAVETQGTLCPEWLGMCDYITVSPKGPGMGEKFEPDKFDYFVQSFVDSGTGFCCKIVLFGQEDIEFAKQIALEWPDVPLFLSLGNPWPSAPATRDVDFDGTMLSNELLERMRHLYDDIRLEPLLASARFLPQLHVLLWANDLGR